MFKLQIFGALLIVLDITSATELLQICAVPIDKLPEEFQKVCEQFGYQLVDSMCSTNMSSLYCQCCDIVGAMPQPITEATNGLPVSCPAPQLPLTQHSDVISISSSSADWEEEYGVMVT